MTTISQTPKPDDSLAAAVDAARTALLDLTRADTVGEHLGAVAEGQRVVTHYFAATHSGYVGWRWAVTLARAPRQRTATVDEVVLLPGDGALLAPPWVPWKDRLDKSDLKPGDIVPTDDSDPRLVPGYLIGDAALEGTSARELREVVIEVGLGRERVLSVDGRDAAADRWYRGDSGPTSAMAVAAPAHCGTCGFLVRLSGPLKGMFGACSNASSPSDGQVVSLDHGCGAHSDVRVEQPMLQATPTSPVFDTLTWDSFGDADVEPLSR